MRKLLIALVVLLLLGVGADRVAHGFAVGEAEKRLRAEGLSDPSVKIDGFPFLTQVLSRTFDDVTVRTPALERDGLRAEQVVATGTGVDVPKDGDAVAETITARGTISYAEVLQQIGREGLQLSRASDDEVRLRRSVTVLGQTLAASARGRVEADGRRIRVVPRGFELEGGRRVTPALAESLTDNFSVTYDVSGLPKGVQFDRITVGESGFVVTLSGRNVRLGDTGAL